MNKMITTAQAHSSAVAIKLFLSRFIFALLLGTG